jgi:tRNA uridine 5-carboxymethylaminomethyl modification enzyme
MFTSRAEYRLLLREDNADFRLTAHGHRLGLVSAERRDAVAAREQKIATEMERLRERRRDGVPLFQWLARPEASYADVAADDREAMTELDVARQVEIAVKYDGYIRRMRQEIEKFRAAEHAAIPDGIDYAAVPGLSTEARERLAAVRPRSLGQASRVPGVTAAAVSILAVWARGLAAR